MSCQQDKKENEAKMSIMTQIEEELHDWRQRADAAEKLAAGLEINLAAVIQRAEAAEGYLAELSPRYADIVAERAELRAAIAAARGNV